MDARVHDPSTGDTPNPRRWIAPIPRAASWLGALGAVPFVFFAILGLVLEDADREQASFVLAAYGAVILSFLGGIHWGLAIADFGCRPLEGASYRRLTLSVVPSLVGWLALVLPLAAGLLILALAFLLMLFVDWRATRQGEAPAWYPKLRWPLTTAVAASLILGTLA